MCSSYGRKRALVRGLRLHQESSTSAMLQDLGFSLLDEVGWRLAAARGCPRRGQAHAVRPYHHISSHCSPCTDHDLRGSRFGSVKHIGFQIQALSNAECEFEIEAWGYTPLPNSWIYSMDRESTMQEQDGGTHTEVERGDGRRVAFHSASALIVAS